MPQQYLRRGFVSLFLLQTTFALSLHSADWPRWRGVTVDNFVPGTDRQIEKLPAEPKTLWRVTLGDGNGSPVKAGDKVFILDKIGTNEVLRAVNAASGKDVWQQLIDEAADDTQGKGPRSTPLVDGDRIYVTSCRGDFQCRKTKDGALLWKKNFTTDFEAVFIGEKPNPIAVGATRHGNNGSPIIDGESLYVQAGGTNGASVVSLDRKSGKLIWKSQSDMAGYGGAYIASIDGQRQLISFTADGVIGLALKDGKLLWRFPIKTTWARHVTTPVVAGNVVIVSSHQHGMFGIAIKKDGDKWTAEQKWLTKEAAINFSSPVLVGGNVYGLGPAKNLVCVEAATGKILWSKDGIITSAAGKAHASLLVFAKSMLVLTDSGLLAQIAIDPAECKVLGQVQVCGNNWCSPAYADGVLYVRDNKAMVAVDLK